MATYAVIKRMIRSHSPSFLIPLFAGIENYLGRLATWYRVIREVQGNSIRDTAILWGSFLVSPISSLSDLMYWREPKLLADATIRVPELGLFGVRAHSDDLGHILVTQNKEMFNVLRDLVRPGDTVVDAGANIGAISVLLARAVGPRGRVIAVEMMPDTAECLRHNLALNGLSNVEIIEKALESEVGRTIKAAVVPGLYGQASIVSTNAMDKKIVISVETTTIDAILAGTHSTAVMKMDLEGAEVRALGGAVRSLDKIRAIVYESLGEKDDVGSALICCGFLISRIDGRNLVARRAG
jgi:FkbM family methyltransferase